MSVRGITSAIERNLYGRLKANFIKAYDMNANDQAYTIWQSVCHVVGSTGKTEEYTFDMPLGDMRRWNDERQFETLSVEDYSLTNADFSLGFEVNANDIADNIYDMYLRKAAELGQAAARHPQIEVTALINEHMTATPDLYKAGFDAKALFATDHTWPNGEYTTSQDNLRGSATAHEGKMDTTYGLTNLQGAWTQMRGYKNEKGRVMGVRPTMVVCSSSVMFAAAEYLTSTDLLLAAAGTTDATHLRGQTNIVQRLGLELREDPNLTSGYWYMVGTADVARGLLWQRRQGPKFESQSTPASDDVFLRKNLKYAVDTRDAVAPMYWFYMVGGDGT